jgi:CheY-like chemotaxis protein
LAKLRILVVEDSEVRIAFFIDILSDFPLTFATSSRDAICLIENESFEADFLNMDLDDGLGRGRDVSKHLNVYSPLQQMSILSLDQSFHPHCASAFPL